MIVILEVSAILAANKEGAIGKDNDLLYNFKEDMAFFSKVATGKVLIMGYRTFKSIPLKGMKKLMERNLGIVLVREAELETVSPEIFEFGMTPLSYGNQDDIVEIFNRLREGSLIGLDGTEKDGELLIIGGASLYNRLYGLGVDTLYFTLVTDTSDPLPEADTFFNMKQLSLYDKCEILEEHSMVTMMKFTKEKATP